MFVVWRMNVSFFVCLFVFVCFFVHAKYLKVCTTHKEDLSKVAFPLLNVSDMAVLTYN